MELPVVNHPDYEAKIGDDNKFPINKFGELANFLKKEKVVKKFYKPEPCSFDTLREVHSEEYIYKIKNDRMKLLHQRATNLLSSLNDWTFDYIPREKNAIATSTAIAGQYLGCLLYTSPSPRDRG